MIVGAGIVGLYLASRLGGVEVWERSERLEPKPCSGLVSLTGLRATGLPWKECVLNYVKGAKFHTKNRDLVIERSSPQAAVLDRDKMHGILLDEAEARGVKVRWGAFWHGHPDPNMPVIGADGALSKVAEAMGSRNKEFVFTYQIDAVLEEPVDPDYVHLYFGDFAPGFFAWVIPKNEREVRIGLGTRKGNARALFNAFARPIKISSWSNPRAGIIPLYSGKRIVDGDKTLVGDAAGQVKNTTGGGIVFGCKSARLLADALDHGDLERYQERFKRLYEPDLKAHARIRKLVDRLGPDRALGLAERIGLKRVAEEEGDMDHIGHTVKKVLGRKAFLFSFF